MTGPQALVPLEVGSVPAWRNCSDDPTYVDKNDISCLDWAYSMCEFAGTVMEYTAAEVNELFEKCPESCNTCVLEPSTSTTFTVVAETTRTTFFETTMSATTTTDAGKRTSDSSDSTSNSGADETQITAMAVVAFILVSGRCVVMIHGLVATL
jgi:hypothetical protein